MNRPRSDFQRTGQQGVPRRRQLPRREERHGGPPERGVYQPAMNSTISTVLFKVLGERHETHSKMLRLFPAAQVPAPAADFKELPRLRAAEGDETVGKL